MRRAALVGLALVGCNTTVDPTGLPTIDRYHEWSQVVTDTTIPGHGDTHRVIYFNDVAKTYPHGGRYPIGSVFVKDVFERSGGLREVSIMRKLGDGANEPVHEGWLFTDLKDGEEVAKDSCFTTCHRVGPYDFAWFDHGL